MRRSLVQLLKARPKTQKTQSGSNMLLEEPFFSRSKEIFRDYEYPNKLVTDNWRFFIRAGKATTGPPVGHEFSKLGLKVMDFVKAFNDKTKPAFKEDVDLIVRVQVYFDRSYNYRIEPPPTAWFILKACRLRRRETGAVTIKGGYAGLITLEMIYEIAKIKQFKWWDPENPVIESRVRSIAGQCRSMGIAIIAVDTPPSPVKGLSAKQYEEQSERYRKEHMVEYERRRLEAYERAPLLERLHRPDLGRLTHQQIKEGLLDPKLFGALWKLSHPGKPGGGGGVYNYLSKDHIERARQALLAKRWLKDDKMSDNEIKMMFGNWKLPALEIERQLAQHQEEQGGGQNFYTRDNPPS